MLRYVHQVAIKLLDAIGIVDGQTDSFSALYIYIYIYIYLIQNSQAVKKVCGAQKGYGEKRCEIQGGGQEMAVMVVKILITTIQVNFGAAWSIGTKFT